MFKKFIVATTFAAFAAGAADAATLKFSVKLGGAAGSSDSYSYSKNGINFSVSAYNHSNGVLGDRVAITKRASGLGATSAGEGGISLDGRGLPEMLVFNFDEHVRINLVSIGYADNKDKLVIANYDGLALEGYRRGLSVEEELVKDGVYDGSSRDTGAVRFGSKRMFEGNVLGIGAGDLDDNFLVKRIRLTVDVPDTSAGRTSASAPVAPVPRPAGGLLLVGALGGLGLMRRRRKA